MAGAAALLAAVLTACSGATPVASQGQGVYLSVPSGWTIYGEKTTEEQNPNVSVLLTQEPAFLVSATADPHPEAADVFSPISYPWALAEVRVVGREEGRAMSFQNLGDIFKISGMGNAQVTSAPQLMSKGTMRGERLTVSASLGAPLDYEQVDWVNNRTNKVWVLVAGCAPGCFKSQRAVIDRLINSFYVKDMGE